MSEEVIRCTKCGGTVAGDTCTACGATGQAAACPHCGNACPPDAKWCPSCGRHVEAGAGGQPPEPAVPPGKDIAPLLVLLGMVVLACVLIWKYAPGPPPTVVAAVGFLFCFAPLSPRRRTIGALSWSLSVVAAACLTLLIYPRVPTTIHSSFATQGAPAPLTRVVERKYQAEPGMLLVQFRDGHIDSEILTRSIEGVERVNNPPHTFIDLTFDADEDPDTGVVTVHVPRNWGGLCNTAELVRVLSADPAVVFAEPDYLYQAAYTPNDPYFDEPYDSSHNGKVDQWYLQRIQAPQAWDHLKGLKSAVRIGIVDTGIDYRHPDLAQRLARDEKGRMIARCFLRGQTDPWDDNGHGTHCAGIAAADSDNALGVAGVSFNSCSIVGAKVLGRKGFGGIGEISRAITWCADQHCRVISLSLGGTMYSQALQDAINYAWKKGALVVAAAGNANTQQPGYPAGCNHVLGVAATDRADRRAFFSNYGVPVAVGAPGVEILSTTPVEECELQKHGYKAEYDALQGTSMACPVVSGIAGALAAYSPELKADDIIRRIESCADNPGSTSGGGWDNELGYGRVNLRRVLSGDSRAATVGGIYGQALSQKGLPIPALNVECAGIIFKTLADGMFRFPNLAPGKHSVELKIKKPVSFEIEVKAGCDARVTLKPS